MSSTRWYILGLATSVALGCPALSRALASPPVAFDPKCGLPVPVGAEVWWDAKGTTTFAVPGVPMDAIQSLRVVIFRPRGDSLTWAQFASLYAEGGVLKPGQGADFSSVSRPQAEVLVPGAVLNVKETNVYRTDGQVVVLGLVRNLRSGNQLAYAVALKGKLDNAQALVQAQGIFETLAERARLDRLRLSPPPGCRPESAEVVLTGAALPQLLSSIEKSREVSVELKRTARAVIPKAKQIRLGTWRTPAPFTDEAFFTYFTQQAAVRGWEQPLVKDGTKPGRPSILFNRPDKAGVVMVRAAPSPINATSRPGTLILILEIDGAPAPPR